MTAEELERYRRSLDETAGRARSYVLRRLADEGTGLDVAERRELAIGIVEDATSTFGDQAQTVAADLFDEIMEADGIDARAETFDGLIDHGRTEGKVHYYARKLVDGDVAGFEGDASDLAAYYVHRSAWENLVRNCDLNHVMWARVPTGRETCGWCYMLASRGFAYHSRESAMAGKHSGCDCVVVPGNADSEVEGLDLQWMRNCWADCSDAVGGPLTREETRALWDALDEGERARWREKHGSKAYEAFHERKSVERICAEVERRDAGWLYWGVEPPVDYAANPREAYGTLRHLSETFDPADYNAENFVGKRGEEWRDLFVHDALKHHGLQVSTRAANAPEGYSNIDLYVGGELWEVKSPYLTKDASPTSLRFIEKRFEQAATQFESIYDPGFVVVRHISKKVILNLRYRPVQIQRERLFSKIHYEMVNNGIDEVLVVFEDGSLERFL